MATTRSETAVKAWRVKLEHLPSGQILQNTYAAEFPETAIRMAKAAAVEQLGHSRWAYGVVRCWEVELELLEALGDARSRLEQDLGRHWTLVVEGPDRLLCTTRRDGSVGMHTPGAADIEEAKRVARTIREEHPGVRAWWETEDEWVLLHVRTEEA